MTDEQRPSEVREPVAAYPSEDRLPASTAQAMPPAVSLAEWLALPENEPGELVDGRLVEDEVPYFVHELVVGLLVRFFGDWVFPAGGAVAASDAKLALSSDRGRKPDLIVYLPGSPLPPRRGPIRVAPDVAVEVVTPTPRDVRRDRVDKVADYAAFQIRYYWIVDPELRSVEILELGSDGRYVHAAGVTSGAIDPVPGCEGLVLDVDDLWATVDRLAPEAAARQQG